VGETAGNAYQPKRSHRCSRQGVVSSASALATFIWILCALGKQIPQSIRIITHHHSIYVIGGDSAENENLGSVDKFDVATKVGVAHFVLLFR
jgi:hypothetical protein